MVFGWECIFCYRYKWLFYKERKGKMYFSVYLYIFILQEMIKSGDLSSVSSMVQHLRTICNHSSSLVYPSHTHTSWNHPWLPEVSPEPSRLISRLLYSSPLDRVSMDNMNLVFLKQELSTTGRLNLFTSLTVFLCNCC
jgi:hypothetical protein